MEFFRLSSIIFLALASTTQLYAQSLELFHLKKLLYFIYFAGLLGPIIVFFKSIILNKIDLGILTFCLFFLASSIYTINVNYTTEFILFLILPLFYLNGKILIRAGKYDFFMLIFFIIVLIVNLYVFIQLINNSLNYHTYYRYSNAVLLVDYLTLSLFNVFAIISLIDKNSINIFIKYFLITFLSIMVFISGARYSIIFLLFFLFLTFIRQPSKKIMLIFLLISIVSIFIFTNKTYYSKISSSLNYSISRLEIFGNKDRSIQEREIAIDDALIAINESPFLGTGINSSENLLSIEYVHNMILETFLETGIINTIILLFIIVTTMFMSWKLYSINNIYRVIFFTNIYLILAHLKSFTIAEGKLLFLFFGIVVSLYFYHRTQNKKASYEINSNYF